MCGYLRSHLTGNRGSAPPMGTQGVHIQSRVSSDAHGSTNEPFELDTCTHRKRPLLSAQSKEVHAEAHLQLCCTGEKVVAQDSDPQSNSPDISEVMSRFSKQQRKCSVNHRSPASGAPSKNHPQFAQLSAIAGSPQPVGRVARSLASSSQSASTGLTAKLQHKEKVQQGPTRFQRELQAPPICLRTPH